MDRRCPACSTFKDVSLFRETASGSLARDCEACEARRAEVQRRKADQPSMHPEIAAVDRRRVEELKDFPGVDIDRIHYLRGAVRQKKKAA